MIRKTIEAKGDILRLEMKYKGIVQSESLNNPNILSSIKPKKMVIERHPESQSCKYGHMYLFHLEEKVAISFIEKLKEALEDQWFSIFWSENDVYVVFKNNLFKLPKEENWSSIEYNKMKEYAVSHGIGAQYLDFNDEFDKFERYVTER